jgi:protein-export membrane protein SecD
MTENIGRKVTLIVACIAISIASMLYAPIFLGEPSFRLGLDLRGGTRLVYGFDFEEALARGQITDAEYQAKGELLQATRDILQDRVDPQGVMELSLRPEGDNRIVIELPGAAELAATKTRGALAAPLAEGDTTATIDTGDPAVVKAFPVTGGVFRIGSEKIAYSERSGATLRGLERGSERTTVAAHAAGADVELLSNDDLQKRIENIGDLQFLLAANATNVAQLGTDLTREQQKVNEWRKAHPGESLDGFNRLAPEEGGPAKGLRWYPAKLDEDQPEVPYDQRTLVPLIVSPEPWVFSGDDLDSVGMSADGNGYPAVAFEFKAEKKTPFGDFTEAHLQEGLAIVLNGEVASVATIQSKLPGSGQITGGPAGYKPKEAQELITVLRSGSLRIKPVLLDKARVGASLGEDYVRTGAISAAVALLLVVVFMVFTYRRLGWFSVIGLFLNLLFLLGALAFLRATLTLPGIAGIILTVGMAVDGNILIFERLREELALGKKLIQAARAAFDRAAVTIIDSNLTTLIAGSASSGSSR